MEPLLTTFTATVSSASVEEMRRTAFLWVDQHCSLVDLRPGKKTSYQFVKEGREKNSFLTFVFIYIPARSEENAGLTRDKKWRRDELLELTD